jgi:hypothetical protein
VSGKGVKHEIIINALRPWRAVAGLEINGIDQPKVRALQRVAGLSVVPAVAPDISGINILPHWD